MAERMRLPSDRASAQSLRVRRRRTSKNRRVMVISRQNVEDAKRAEEHTEGQCLALAETVASSRPLSPPTPSANVGIETNGLARAGVQIADQRNSGWLNAQLYAAPAIRENLKIISRATFLARKPAYRTGPDLSDGLHPTAAGTARTELHSCLSDPGRSVIVRKPLSGGRWRWLNGLRTRKGAGPTSCRSGPVTATRRDDDLSATYGHLWPDADESARAAVGGVLAARADSEVKRRAD